MRKNVKESKLSPVEVAAFDPASEELAESKLSDPASEELVEVQALRNVNTTLYGNIREGQKGKVSALMAKQLEQLGEVKILK